MPTPAKISASALAAAASEVLERGGLDAFTMQAVAERLGVRAPSLYKHVRDREALLDVIRLATLDALTTELAAVAADDPGERIVACVMAARAFGRRLPVSKALAFTPSAGVPVARLQAATAPLLEACAALVGERAALDAARTVTAWMHGFTEMERMGAFRLGGDADAAYAWGARALVRAMRAA